ncbi:MAG: M48 family metallopeptidase [Candidatus Acidiferrales bacterium]
MACAPRVHAEFFQGAQPAPVSNASPTQTTPPAPLPPEKRITAYTLPPGLYRKAHALGQIACWFLLANVFYSLLVLWLMLKWRLAPKFRDWAERAGSARVLQAAIFAPLFVLTFDVFMLPTAVLRHWVTVKFGLSIQRWPSWIWDWTKGQMIAVVLSTLLVWLLYAVIRRSLRRWWFYFWLVSLPLLLLAIFLTPVVIDPMFHKFVPLSEKDPALAAGLERMVQRAGENIPVGRMFWMGASEKSTTLNAYVTGIGASKRIVVWDTTVAKMTTPQIVAVAGHEMGHYVLHHIWEGVTFGAVLLFVFFYFGFRCIGGMLNRWGSIWKIRGVDDWASLPALLLLLTLFDFCTTPIESAFSRYLEHQADQYSLEVTHGLTPDSGQVAAQAFQILGEVDLSDPAPNPVAIFLFYDHPPIPDRIRFCLTYDPWSKGESPEFVK